MCFTDRNHPSKVCSRSDLKRFFTINDQHCDELKLEIFFTKILDNKPLDLSMLHRIMTQTGKISIVSNHSTHLSGFDQDNRRAKAHNTVFNDKTLASLTKPINYQRSSTKENVNNRKLKKEWNVPDKSFKALTCFDFEDKFCHSGKPVAAKRSSFVKS
jgi:hypothetical protein